VREHAAHAVYLWPRLAAARESSAHLQAGASVVFTNRSFVIASLMVVASSAGAAAQTSVILPGPSGRAHVKFEIRVPTSVRTEPLTGRVYVIISTDSTREPRTQVGRVGAPLFGHDVERLAPGAAAIVDGADLGTPVFDLADVPAGDYWIQ